MASIKKLVFRNSLQAFDHRHIGFKQNLFLFDELSQGSCFFLPRGAHIYNKLIEYLRKEYRKRNYNEVITPNIFDSQIWKNSGHWDHYQENIIKFKLRDRDYGLKPMNCPSHCLMFKHHRSVTSDQLPFKWADFGALHRNELSGALLGLTRVRRFQQDDAHIFCTPDQVETEVEGCLQFAQDVYGRFDFNFELKLSSRPENYLGDSSLWDKAEESLRMALDKSQSDWEEQKHEGAFYGPKIDLVVKDCRQRSHQCATIQLDFQLPEKFDLLYKDTTREPKTMRRPVIIHRAILGSIERFMAMIAENCAGRWPFWLSPLQAIVIPVHPSLSGYAKRVRDEFHTAGYWVDCDLSNETLNAKVREASTMPYNLILIVGEKEMNTNSVTSRIEIAEVPNAGRSDVNMKPSVSKLGSRKVVRNINISNDKLLTIFEKFDRTLVDRADIELFKLTTCNQFEQ